MSAMASRGPRFYLDELRHAVLDSRGVTDPALRKAVASGSEGLPSDLAPVIDTIRRHAYKITDEDLAKLKAAGRSEDEIFELTCAAALGVSLYRCERALATLDDRNDKDD
jgi:hypothetical protein